jgi:cytochrome c oxidase subunit 3
MPATFTHKPARKQRKDPGLGGQPPALRRPTGGGGDGGGDDNWEGGRGGPRELLLRIRFRVFSALAGDMMFFAVLVAVFFASHGASHQDPRTHLQVGDWHPVALPRILYLNTVVLLLSSLTMEFARRNIFREIDALEEWLGMGRPALNRALPWLGATLALGALFLAGQWAAWKQLAGQGFAFGEFSTPASYFFYLITGFHAAHLLAGVLALILCLSALGWLRRIELRQIAIDSTAWYWHTMSLVWLLLLGVLALGQ